MDEGEMGDVEEVLDDARALGAEAVGAGENLAEAGVFGFGKGGDFMTRGVIERGTAGERGRERDPDKAVSLPGVEDVGVGLEWGRLVGV